jgi:uncharacterized protein DUF5615
VRIKLDENVPLRLATTLEERGHQVDTVQQEGLTGHPDPDVAAAASAVGRIANGSTGQVGRHALPLREGFYRPLRTQGPVQEGP